MRVYGSGDDMEVKIHGYNRTDLMEMDVAALRAILH
jgi:hypothetical protein